MLAYRLAEAQTQPDFQDVPEPQAGPGQVVVRVAASGLCHTDFTVISRERSYWKNEPPPFTLGHEIADASELGRRALENVLRELASDLSLGA